MLKHKFLLTPSLFNIYDEEEEDCRIPNGLKRSDNKKNR
jgi:hypothetical protein